MVQSFGSAAVASGYSPISYNSGKLCPECGKELMLTEAAVLLQIVVPQLNEARQVFYLPFEGADGGYAYEPYFFHADCWAANNEALDTMLTEYDCRAVHDDYSFMTCKLCHSGLRLNEPAALVSHGELRASRRSPDGNSAPTFHTHPNGRELLCLACIRTLNDEIMEMWKHISYSGECTSCTYDRIWRTGGVCPPEHHVEDEDEEEDEGE
jgi:hypothetical protein